MKKLLITIFVAVSTLSVNAQVKKLDITVTKNGPAINPNMYGVFFEDINFGADGGVYAELIKNRSFEFFRPLMGWNIRQRPFVEGNATIQNRPGQTNNPRFLRLKLNDTSKEKLSIENEGFRGMGLKAGLDYDFSIMYRLLNSSGIKLHIELLDTGKHIIGKASLSLKTTDTSWSKATSFLSSNQTVEKGSFRMWIEGSGILDMDMVSLFPTDTWKGRKGGMRADMVQMLADMKPGFLRFPGGCIVEGFDLSQRYRWKNTVGPVEERQLIINRWNFEFAHRPTPDYFQTFGLGFFEYFQLAEDMNAEPLPILNCGMACQFNTGEVVAMKDMQPYIDDALDLIEFANGDVSTTWGKVRSNMGHPASFNLKYIGIGNENWGPQYIERLKLFQDAIKAKYPQMKIVASSGTDPDGERFDYLNNALREMKIEVIDEHFYRRPEWFFANASRYDNYPRTASKIFCGEYAAQSDRTVSVNNENNWITALSEAAFLTGLERNADVVEIASYAPLFAHKEGWQWRPDLIWVDNLKTVGTTDYQVQKLFSIHKGTNVISVTLNGMVLSGNTDSLYASGSFDNKTNVAIVKVVNGGGQSQTIDLSFKGGKVQKNGTAITLQNNDLRAGNTLLQPETILPQTSSLKSTQTTRVTIKPYSVNIYKINLRL